MAKEDFQRIKRDLISARTFMQDAMATARRKGFALLAERLRDISENIANELDYVERQIERL